VSSCGFVVFSCIVDHVGNLRYQTLLDHYQATYEKAKKYQKMKISHQILARVAQYGGRFLRQEGAGWIEVDPAVARDKIAHAFRTRRVANNNSGGVVDAKQAPLPDGTKLKNTDIMALYGNPLRVPWSTLPVSTETELGDDALDSLTEDEYAQPDKRIRRCDDSLVSPPSPR
jgi:hypothetical protein